LLSQCRTFPMLRWLELTFPAILAAQQHALPDHGKNDHRGLVAIHQIKRKSTRL
jgi:hypothetical protein